MSRTTIRALLSRSQPPGKSLKIHKKPEGDMSPPRAADDFLVIRARMEELRRERIRPRAADDFRAIRARMEELRRERAQISAEKRSRSGMRPKPCHRTARSGQV